MENFEPKKLLILRILEILQDFSDSNHKLRQKDIIHLLRVQYDVDCERKAVARNIEFLQHAGYDIISDSTGVYLAERKFELGELRLLIDSVLSNKNVCTNYTKELIDKLTCEGGHYFKNYAKHVINLDEWQKTDDKQFFLKVEQLCEAIEKKKKIQFHYLTYSTKLSLIKRRENKYFASPYQLLMKNGNYYLACCFDNHDNLAFLRVDKMLDIKMLEKDYTPIQKVKDCKNGLNIGKLSNCLPYLYFDTPAKIEFQTTQQVDSMIDMVVDQFGKNIQVEKLSDNNLKFTLFASLKAMRFWLLQFGKYVKVLSPSSLCDDIKNDAKEIQNLYK